MQNGPLIPHCSARSLLVKYLLMTINFVSFSSDGASVACVKSQQVFWVCEDM